MRLWVLTVDTSEYCQKKYTQLNHFCIPNSKQNPISRSKPMSTEDLAPGWGDPPTQISPVWVLMPYMRRHTELIGQGYL